MRRTQSSVGAGVHAWSWVRAAPPAWFAPGDREVSGAEVDERAGDRFRIWQADAGRDTVERY
jgi:hypothetical protein